MRLNAFLVAGLLLTAALGNTGVADTCDLNDPTLLKPDLVVLPLTHVRQLHATGHRIIIFSTSVGNIGDGPLVMQGHTIDGPNGPVTQAEQIISRTDGTTCTHVAGDFEFHPTHNHWHFGDFASYQLRKDDPFTGAIVAESTKVSFCLIDVTRIHGFSRDTSPTFTADCLSQEGTQGIDVGFADVYDSLLPGQSIDLDADPNNPVPGGTYFLVNTVNPDGLVWEINDDPQANSAFASVTVSGPASGIQPPAPTNVPAPSPPSPTSTNPPVVPTPRLPVTLHPVHTPHQPDRQLLQGSGSPTPQESMHVPATGPVTSHAVHTPHQPDRQLPQGSGSPTPQESMHVPATGPFPRNLHIHQPHQPHTPHH